ncbi:26195_t:CDS:2, partial [Racocetra persica]
NEKYVSGSALYQIKDDEESFREIIYKGFTRSSETLIDDFEKNSIVLIIGQYVYNEDIEYNYTNNINESQTLSSSNKRKEKTCDELNNQLDLIEEKYAKIDA